MNAQLLGLRSVAAAIALAASLAACVVDAPMSGNQSPSYNYTDAAAAGAGAR